MNYRDHIKAVAFDFDGTLIDFDYSVTEYTRTALRKLKENGYIICLASGRPCFLGLKAFRSVFDDIELDYVFGCNGSEIMDVKKDETKIMFPLEVEEIRYLARVLDKDYLHLIMYDGDKSLINRKIESDELKQWLAARWLEPTVYDFQKNDIPRSKLLVLNTKKDRSREEEFISSVDLSAFNGNFSSPYCFEIAPKGISKAKSCEVLSEILGCDMTQILSFGDNGNDVEMLKATTGVLMENAPDYLKPQFELHTSSVNELGVYDFLHKNGLI
ncbi:MAG: HAD family phosphatase [Oscillospiraceae bacterium]|nr:HAD family phosphatase [Oscillospiraceae bacterium]MBQ6493960.1 HAD family phosphatase [Erysipelotrichaceae bacterium]